MAGTSSDNRRNSKGRPRLPDPGEASDNVSRRSRVNPVFGMKLKLLRTQWKMSQSDLSREMERTLEIKIPYLVFGRIERGKQGPTLQELFAVYEFFKVDLEWLADDRMKVGQEARKDSESFQEVMSIARRLGSNEAIRRLLDPKILKEKQEPVSSSVAVVKGKIGKNETNQEIG